METQSTLEQRKIEYLQLISNHIGLDFVHCADKKNRQYKFNLYSQWVHGLCEQSYDKVGQLTSSRPEYIYRKLMDSFSPFFLMNDVFDVVKESENAFLLERLIKAKSYTNKYNLNTAIVTERNSTFWISYSHGIQINENNVRESFKRILSIVPQGNLNYFAHLLAFSKFSPELLKSIVVKSEVDENLYGIRNWVTSFDVYDVNSWEYDDSIDEMGGKRFTYIQTSPCNFNVMHCNHCNTTFISFVSQHDLERSFTEVIGLGKVLDVYRDDYYYINGEYYENEDYYEENYGNKYVDDYHSGNDDDECVTFNNVSPFRIGYEIEKEDSYVLESLNIHEFKRESGGMFRKERDGSLSDESGYEIITPIYELDSDKIHQHLCKYRTIETHINGEVDKDTCGGHISISNINKDTWRFYSDIENYIPLFYAMYPNRCSQNYCKAKTKDRLKTDNEKYQALKIYSNRIEIRIFPAVNNVPQLMFRTRLLELILSNPTDNYLDSYKVIRTKIVPFLLESGVYNKDKVKRLVLRLRDSYAKYGFNEMDFDNESDYESDYFDN